MNAAGTGALEAAGAEGTRLASGGSSRLRRRGRPEELQAAAPGGAGEWQAAGAPPRFLPVPPPRPHPAATPGPASGWAALLVLGLLVAGAADGCELVPKHLRVRRASGSAAAAASSPAAAAGDSPALMTGEGPGCGGRGSAGPDETPHLREGPAPLPGALCSTASDVERCRAGPPDSSALAAASSRFLTVRTPSLSPPPSTPLSTEPLDGPRFPALQWGSPAFHAEQCRGSLLCCRIARRVCRGRG